MGKSLVSCFFETQCITTVLVSEQGYQGLYRVKVRVSKVLELGLGLMLIFVFKND